MKTTLRQGDVMLIRSKKTPSAQAKRITDQGRTILAYGEQTGHAHEVIALAPPVTDTDPVPAQQLFEEPDGTRLLVISKPCSLRHEEHDPIALEIGSFEIRRQAEWSLDQIRRVAD